MRNTIAVGLTSLVLTFGGTGVVAAEPLEQPQPVAQTNGEIEANEDEGSDKTGLWGLLGLLGLLGAGGLVKRGNKDVKRYDSNATHRPQP